MKARWVLVVVCVVAGCGGKNHGGVTDVATDIQAVADTVDGVAEVVVDVSTDTGPLLDTYEVTPSSDLPDHTDADVPCIPDCNGKECMPPKPHVFNGACVECLTDEDCGDETLICNLGNHRCEPTSGECKGLWSDFLGCGVWPIDDEACDGIDPGLGLCTCSTPFDMEGLSTCLPPDFCAGGTCPPEALCVDASVLEFMFGAAAPFEDGVCLPMDWMVVYDL